MPAPTESSLRHVLIVDDQPAAREVVRDVLEMNGSAVLEAENCQIALDVLETQAVGVVVADIFMHGARPDGIDMIARIRASRPQIRIVAVSGGGGGADGSAALRAACLAGADIGLAKPFSARDLLAAVSL